MTGRAAGAIFPYAPAALLSMSPEQILHIQNEAAEVQKTVRLWAEQCKDDELLFNFYINLATEVQQTADHFADTRPPTALGQSTH